MTITLPNILDTIGNTPLVKLTSFQRWIPKEVSIFAKLESKNPGGSVKDRAAKKMIKENPGKYYMPDQYNNPNNWKAHYETTAEEVWKQSHGKLTHFVAGIGTSGTLMGTGKRLRELKKEIQVIAVEPEGALHGLEGLKHMESSIVPGIYDPSGYDRKISVFTEDAYEMTCRLARQEGILAGYSSGAALQACYQLEIGIKQGLIVTIFPDGGERYLQTQFWYEVLKYWEEHWKFFETR